MNSLVQQFDVLRQTHALHDQLLDSLTDADLAYRLPGANPSLGELCREMGQVAAAYIESFRTLRMQFNYPAAEPGIEHSAQRLRDWFKRLDSELENVLSSLSEADIENKVIERGWSARIGTQFHVYREAWLIFYGKADTYLKALDKPLTKQWQQWIG